MGNQAIAAIFDAGFCIAVIASARFPQGIQWTVAEQAIELFRICSRMAGKKLTGSVLKEFIVFHGNPPIYFPFSVL